MGICKTKPALNCFLFARSRGALFYLFAQSSTRHAPSARGGMRGALSLSLVASFGVLLGKGDKG